MHLYWPFDPSDSDRVLKLSREHKYHGDYVFTINNFYYEDINRVRPGLIETQLDPKVQQEQDSQITLVGELHIYESSNLHLIMDILQIAGISENLYMTREELMRASPTKTDNHQYACFRDNCPIDDPIGYSVSRLDDYAKRRNAYVPEYFVV